MLADDLKLPESLLILLENVGPVTRRKALREASQYLLKQNRQRMSANVTPDGLPMLPRQDPDTHGRQPQKLFLYKNKQGRRKFHMLMTLKDEGDYFEGWDHYEEGVRRFRYDRVIREYKRTPKAATRMFQQINKQIKRVSQAEREEVGFYGLLGKLATDHHEGRVVEQKHYRFALPERPLLGISEADAEQIRRIILEHITKGVR